MGFSLVKFVIMKDTKKKTPCSKKLGGYLREQKGRLYIIRRCVRCDMSSRAGVRAFTKDIYPVMSELA
ncbi:hypothetical protein Bca52824_015215 [Brassica carinata]|uniref:Uncharacterized protein n=1 Tax=Brassica carinata TaxID=52824 RepID=A0A8X8B5H8_BRACI|nr:hypothetical protein Bca52824_015215 [Brassica carinata]